MGYARGIALLALLVTGTLTGCLKAGGDAANPAATPQTPARKPDMHRLLLFGDSITLGAGRGITEQQTFGAILKQKLTAAVGAADARVWEGAIAWCGRHRRSVNSARLKRVVAEMGIAADALAEFGSAARRAGAPPWPVTGGAERSTPRGESRDDLVVVRPTRDAARLLWSLRATFGVNARADIVANLLARPGSLLTVLELAHLTRHDRHGDSLCRH